MFALSAKNWLCVKEKRSALIARTAAYSFILFHLSIDIINLNKNKAGL